MIKTSVKTVKITDIKLNPDNPRTITGRAMDNLIKSLKDFPEMLNIREIVVDETMTILGGNMRYLALKKSGAKECTAKIVTGLTPEQKREFVIKDNASFGEFDFDALANSWSDLPLIDWGVDLPEDWLQPPIDVIDPTGDGMSGSNYGDARSDKVPVNILGIGGMVSRDVMEQTKKKLLLKGAMPENDNGDAIKEIFTLWVRS